MANEKEVLACSEGQFRLVRGQRVWVNPSRATVERLQADLAKDEGKYRVGG
jgi:hypothetical protein